MFAILNIQQKYTKVYAKYKVLHSHLSIIKLLKNIYRPIFANKNIYIPNVSNNICRPLNRCLKLKINKCVYLLADGLDFLI